MGKLQKAKGTYKGISLVGAKKKASKKKLKKIKSKEVKPAMIKETAELTDAAGVKNLRYYHAEPKTNEAAKELTEKERLEREKRIQRIIKNLR